MLDATVAGKNKVEVRGGRIKPEQTALSARARRAASAAPVSPGHEPVRWQPGRPVAGPERRTPVGAER